MKVYSGPSTQHKDIHVRKYIGAHIELGHKGYRKASGRIKGEEDKKKSEKQQNLSLDIFLCNFRSPFEAFLLIDPLFHEHGDV